MIYFDNAATSWPKPPQVIQAMADFLAFVGANPGRAGHHKAVQAGKIVYNARLAVAELFKAENPLRVIFTYNVTHALNLCLHGILHPGAHIITGSMEHNSVMRPLRMLEKKGVKLSIVQCSQGGNLDPRKLESCIRTDTKLVVLNHASNVTGTLLPVKEVGAVCRKHNVLFLVDAAQTAGCYPIDMQSDCIDFLAFTGHKALNGPMGTGGLIIGGRVDEGILHPLMQGGTGSNSENEEQPDFLPDALEAGTINAVGLAGLTAGIDWINNTGLETIRSHDLDLTRYLLDGLGEIPGVTVYGDRQAAGRTAVVSFTIDKMSVSEAGLRLDEEYGIQCRVGLHCAPIAHKTLGTFPQGTIRFGLGYFNTETDVEKAVSAVKQIAVRALCRR
jgi:cysteine desulfurase/selenocysteine lyase